MSKHKFNLFNDLMILKRIVLSNKRTYENLLKEHNEKQLRCLKLFDKHKVPDDAPKFAVEEMQKTYVKWQQELQKVKGKKYILKVQKRTPATLYREIKFKKLKKFQKKNSLRSKMED